MIKKILKMTYYWGPAIIWIILIFYLSSRQSVQVSDEYTINFLVFKSLHVFEYAILYFFLFRGFYSLSSKQFTLQKKFIFSIFIALLFAIFDEVHQTFVPTREGKLRDVLIDSLGIFLCFVYTKNQLHFLRKLL